MRLVCGVVLIVGGILLGLWLGVWVLFIGGIVSIIEAAKANPVDAYRLAWGIFGILVASPVGCFAAYICVALGAEVIMRKKT